jgi:site-specific DNA recombinase
MTVKNVKRTAMNIGTTRCAVYTRKSTEDGLEQEFNSLDAQREAGEAYIKSQISEGWECLADLYDDGGFTGANMDRPALKRLLSDIEAGRIDVVVVYKVDRLSRSLLDFARMMEAFERHHISFVSVTQQFNTATSMGRLILNVLLSFAQFEREMISERTRDKIAATRRKGKWSGGMPLLGYDVVDTKLIVNSVEAERVRAIFNLYLEYDGLLRVVQELDRRGWHNKLWITRKGIERGGRSFDKNSLWHLLTNVTYIGKVKYKGEVHDGEHVPIVCDDLWRRVQTQLERNGRTGVAAVRNKNGALLKGLLHCVACGCAMSPTHSTRNRQVRYRYYTCSAAQKRGWRTCPAPSIPAGEVERFVVDHIKRIGRDPQLVEESVRQASSQRAEGTGGRSIEKRQLRRELARHNSDVQTLARGNAVVNGNTLMTARLAGFQERKLPEHQITELRDDSQSLSHNQVDKQDMVRALAKFEPVWVSLSPREQGRLLQLLIDRIDYDGRGGTIAITLDASGVMTLVNSRAEERFTA